MKIKKGFVLRKQGMEYMAVPLGAAGKEFNGMIRLNEVGQFLWHQLEKGITEDELVAAMTERYTGLEVDRARADLKAFMSRLPAELIEE